MKTRPTFSVKISNEYREEMETSGTKPPLRDMRGRVADDLRISVTDKCNFRCTYCMPAEGLEWLPKQEVLTFEEITRIAQLLVECGVNTIRLTGGEPLVRKDLSQLVAQLRALGDGLDISITTNGFLLADQAAGLAAAGLDRVNVSCDSLLTHRFAEMTRRDALYSVMEGLKAAEDAGLGPVKLNTVVIRGTNDDEIVDFARFSRSTGYQVRFIEYMPLDAQHAWERPKVVPSKEVLEKISDAFSLEPVNHGAEPATLYRFADGTQGAVGVIASVTEPFCKTCNRIRVTADGHFRNCLFAMDEIDLKTSMRSGAGNDELETLIRSNLSGKWAGHRIDQPDFVQPIRSMSQIGG